MLQSLSINNYALIKDLEITPSQNLNIITGETGAGKSIMLGAVGLLLGNRVDTSALFDQDTKCIIEGIFIISGYDLKDLFIAEDLDYNDECIVRREINIKGKSRAFINDTPVTLDTLKLLGIKLMDVHSQHDTTILGSNEYQLYILDSYAQNSQALASYRHSYDTYKVAKTEFEELNEYAKTIGQEEDFINFQLEELSKADLRQGEQEQLEEELKLSENAEDIKMALANAMNLLANSENSIQSQLSDLNQLMNQLGNYSEKFNELAKRVNSTSIEISDIESELNSEDQNLIFDPGRLQDLQERIGLIYSLQQKHRVNSIDELISLRDEFAKKANQASNMEVSLEDASIKLKETRDELQEQAEALSKSRTLVMEELCNEIESLFLPLGIKEGKLRIEHSETEPGKNGRDEIKFLFSANKGLTPQELKKVASGGEFARLMFCVKYVLADKTSLPTIIFDEIDNGVSGEIAIQLGSMMKKMAKNHQVFTISHLPQIASKGDEHFYVYKDASNGKTVSKIKLLDKDERVKEIAKMIAGEDPTLPAIDSAKQMLSGKI